MRMVLVFAARLKWLGLLGFISFFSDWFGWGILWLFWLFGLVEILFSFPLFFQSLQQIYGMLLVSIQNKVVPDKDNFIPAIRYSLPFEDEWMVANGGVTRNTSHSWEIQTQRYAYDFLVLDQNGKSYDHDGTNVEDYHCYGKTIISPADGTVIEIRTDCRDSKIMGRGKTDPLIKDIRGNYIVIRHADNEYSCLAHLKPDSISVNEGQKVKRGQPIARCGNSGNTSEPHLHFQIQDGRSFFTSMGLPIHFENIESCAKSNGFNLSSLPDKYIEDEFIVRGQQVRNGTKA